MASNDFLRQLQRCQDQLAQLKEPSLATIGVVTHLWGGTAHEDQDPAAAVAASVTLVCGLLTGVSHTRAVEASPAPASGQAAFRALDHAAVGSGAAVDDVVLRRLPGRALRDGQGLLRGV